MSCTALKALMDELELRVIDVASMARVSPDTVRKFLNGHRINPVLQEKIIAVVQDKKLSLTASKAVG